MKSFSEIVINEGKKYGKDVILTHIDQNKSYLYIDGKEIPISGLEELTLSGEEAIQELLQARIENIMDK